MKSLYHGLYEKAGDVLTSVLMRKDVFVESAHYSITWDGSPGQDMKHAHVHQTAAAVCVHSAGRKRPAAPSFCTRWIKACPVTRTSREGTGSLDLAGNSYAVSNGNLININ